jgi:hypothetical protein
MNENFYFVRVYLNTRLATIKSIDSIEFILVVRMFGGTVYSHFDWLNFNGLKLGMNFQFPTLANAKGFIQAVNGYDFHKINLSVYDGEGFVVL